MNYTIYETLMQEIFALKDKLHVFYKNVKNFLYTVAIENSLLLQ